MKIIENENVVVIDVDQTLLLWDSSTTPGPDKLKIPFADDYVYLTPHNYHVALVKMWKQRGYLTIVWSANGVGHAGQAVKALKLGDYVDFIMTKPAKYLDDSDATHILGPRVYCEDYLKANV